VIPASLASREACFDRRLPESNRRNQPAIVMSKFPITDTNPKLEPCAYLYA
jgi:hypothetical protein